MNMINLGESFISFMGQRNSWRVDIESVLSSENKNFYLLKECTAEIIGEHPFSFPRSYEFFGIIEDDKTHLFRTSSVDAHKGILQSNVNIKHKKNLTESNINYLSFEKAHEIVSSNKISNVYCKIEYEYETIKYSLIAKCSYINYNSEKNTDKYLQPIMGYVPFVLKNQLRYGYVALNVNKKNNNYLEFLLNEKSPIISLSTSGKQNLIRLSIKKILNKLLFFLTKNAFTKLISIKESKINFFLYD